MSVSLVVTSVGVTVSAAGWALATASALPVYNATSKLGPGLNPFTADFQQRICTAGSDCECIQRSTMWGSRVICIECQECGKICMSDHGVCRECLVSCTNCICIETCGQTKCLSLSYPVTKIAVGSGILFLATAALAFFFKIFLMCCFKSVGRGRGNGSQDDDTASLNTVDRFVAYRLRDAPPGYDTSIGPNNAQLSEHRQRAAPSPDKPPAYNPTPIRGELSLQVVTLADAPPPYSFSYENQAFTTEDQTQERSPALVPTTPRSPSPPPPFVPGRELCRTLTM